MGTISLSIESSFRASFRLRFPHSSKALLIDGTNRLGRNNVSRMRSRIAGGIRETSISTSRANEVGLARPVPTKLD